MLPDDVRTRLGAKADDEWRERGGLCAQAVAVQAVKPNPRTLAPQLTDARNVTHERDGGVRDWPMPAAISGGVDR